MQSKPLPRNDFTEAHPETLLPKDKELQVVLPQYGLVESSLCFSDTYQSVFVDHLQMSPCTFDPYFLLKTDRTKISGTTGLANDDSINIGDIKYQSSEENATATVITKKDRILLYDIKDF